jgi:hypothetical protein
MFFMGIAFLTVWCIYSLFYSRYQVSITTCVSGNREVFIEESCMKNPSFLEVNDAEGC